MQKFALRFAPIIAGVVTFCLYVLTQAPGLMYTDTGELAAAAYTWGVAHPTGYPLFTLVAHVWTLLPWPSVIGGLNILAAIFVAAGVGLFCRMLQVLPFPKATDSHIPLAVALLLGTSTIVWGQSTAIEVYSLHFLLVIGTLSATLRSRNEDGLEWTVVAGFMFGLCLTNHVSSVFLAPGLLLLWWKGALQWRPLAALFVPVILCLSLYALMPLRSSSLPPINWGWVHRSWDAFLYHVKGTQFSVWMFSDNAVMKANANVFLKLASHALLWAGWIPALLGVVSLVKGQRRMMTGLLVVALGNLAITLGYGIHDIDSYFLPSIIILFVFCAIGLHRLLSAQSATRTLGLLLLPCGALVMNYSSMNYRAHTSVPEYANFTWDHLEPNAVFITRQWDFLCSAMWYQQVVEGKRPDVTIIDKELLRRTWYIPHLQHLYPATMLKVERQAAEYQTWLASFEDDSEKFMRNPRNSSEIQTRFISLLNAILDSNNQHPLYITPEILNEEPGFAPGYIAIPVGPMYRLTRDTTLRVRTQDTRLPSMANTMKNYHERLDSSLRETLMGILAADAIYTVQVLKDSAYGYNLRDLTISFDPDSRISRTLQSRLP
ncbi:MAG: DUF2723 domain-containing protein [Chlorobi bacterium]|nr:MAG: DUF2723 domain-containing protein [Bacteroidota bacterium]MBE2265225.1 DUF2723 domain-containing protein [Flavobacteriales bacterium]MBL1160974.1 DUF2723 domain-containing protein [Chlorobiota bacterium]MBW7852932.1 DUF2723 domain-containing protein [Candidatus Kapabacteria bacterium]MCC6330816.1 DUF2723 domain-containing protein [Ignavibacteria bacterium]